MFAPGLPPALRRAVCLAQSFSRCRVARDTWRSGQRRACSGKPGAPGGGDDGARRTGSVPGNASPGKSTKLNAAQRPAVQRALVDGPDARARPARSVDDDTLDGVNKRPGKDRKLLFVSAKIAQHDLQTKTKNVAKLVSKGHEVKITIFEGGADVVSSTVILPSVSLHNATADRRRRIRSREP
ncbi:PREDICTED: uncharacterized protein LOC105565321 isoform X2 [Vollenhovia emeryi]|uniref:uncharacterized protein LOC105565321 isoform X2 n=1 Tax=Vollenhovia emeryi TaxID=411798 RepID=UPI0005F57502|nr:PREDICTED: uncharacterized protein LOC105565321 isoform X2 [Vollenhovia emeryi]